MPLKSLSICGNNCFTFLTLLIIILTSISITTTYWFVGFGDCQVNDNYYFINLSDGLCYSNSNQENDASCTSWNDLTNNNINGNTAESSAHDYITAKSLGITSLVFGIILFILIIIHRFINITSIGLNTTIRTIELIISVLISILLCILLIITSNTYYTNPTKYGFDSICDSELSIPFTGWFCTFISFIVIISIGIGLYAPCCGCQGENDEDGELPLNRDNGDNGGRSSYDSRA